MAVQIRRAALESDSGTLMELSRRHLAPQSDRRRFDWLYVENPWGPAQAWLVHDDVSGEAIGAAAAFPRKFIIGGMEKMGLVFGDFCLDERYRSLGPALRLQRACLEALEPPFDFFYDFPSESMMAIYKRLGVSQTGNLVRWAKPLNLEDKLTSLSGSRTIGRGLGVIANAALATRGYKGKDSACELSTLEGSFGKEFDSLDEQIHSSPCVRTLRTANYLNWRFHENPTAEYETLTARRDGIVIGYVILTRDPKLACIAELSSVEEPGVIARLLAGAVEKLKERGAATANMTVGADHPWSDIFERAGFLRRETSPFVVGPRKNGPLSQGDFTKCWYLMQGERDS